MNFVKLLFIFSCALLYGGGTSPQLITVTTPLSLLNGNISIPSANGSRNGFLSSADWSTFNSKLNSFSVTAPLTYSSNIIAIPQATSLVDGFLSQTDWTTFNSKAPSGNYITALTSDVSASGPGSVAATVNSVGGSSASAVHSGELLSNAATNLNTVSTIVKRDSSGNFSAGTITGSLTGHASLDLPAASPAYTGTMLTPLTASRALVTDGSSNLAVSATTAAELLFVNGVTSNIQTQLDGKQSTGNFISALTGDGTATGPGSVALTLATVNSNTGSFGSSTAIPNFTVNGKGLLTAAGTNAVIAPASTLTGTTLASNVVTSSLTSLGTIATGVWQGTTIAIANGGTGATTQQAAINALTGTQSSGTYLRSNGTNASLTAIQAADVPTLNQNTTGTALNITASSNTSLTSLSNLATVGTITSGTWNGTVLGSTYGGLGGDFHLSTGALSISSGTVSAGNLSIANGGTGQATKSTAFDALSPMTTLGDLTYGGASGTGTRLAGDTSNTRKFLREVSSGGVAAAPAWDTIAAADVPTLNQNTTGTALNITASSNTSLTSLSNLATVGTITSGTWTGTTIATANGGTGVTSVTTSPTASSFAGWDANSNLSANAFVPGYTTTATAGATTTLTVSSTYQQYFTGSTTQTVKLPVVTTLVNGQSFLISNASSGLVTVQSSGANTLQAMGANTQLVATVVDKTAGTGTASWNWVYTTGALTPVNLGGTGLSSITAHDLLIGNGTSAATLLAPSATTGVPLVSAGSSSDPAYGQLNLASSSAVTNTLPVGNGGTGQSSNWTNHGALYASSTTALSSAATGSSGYVFMSNGSSSDPTMQSLQGNTTALKAPTTQTFTSTGSTVGYVFTVSSANATVGATYTNNGNTYTVLATISAATTLFCSQASAPQASGTLTRASGSGDATITFSAAVAYATYTAPSSPSPLYLKVKMVGGGGGGGGSGSTSGTAPTVGKTSYFGTNLLIAPGGGAGQNSTAGAGPGGGGTAGTINSPATGSTIAGTAGGGSGTQGSASIFPAGAYGGGSPFFGGGGYNGPANAGAGNATANTGGGGGGAGGAESATTGIPGSGGGGGSGLEAFIGSPSGTYIYVVGAGGGAGGAGSSGFAGGTGAAGRIEVAEFYQ